jgi:hypothetical protein
MATPEVGNQQAGLELYLVVSSSLRKEKRNCIADLFLTLFAVQ